MQPKKSQPIIHIFPVKLLTSYLIIILLSIEDVLTKSFRLYAYRPLSSFMMIEKNCSRQRLNSCHVIPELHVDRLELGS